MVRGLTIRLVGPDDALNEGRKEIKLIASVGLNVFSPERMTGDSVGFKVAESTDVLGSLK